MRIELERYRRLHVTYDELCVAAAFLEIPCIYGASSHWMKLGQESLHTKVTRVTAGLERRGLLLTELGGNVRMSKRLYQLVSCMGQAERVARVGYTTPEGERQLYLYRKGETLAFLEGDGRGGCHLGSIKSAEQLQQVLKEIPEAVGPSKKQTDLFSMETEEWMSGLVFEKQGTFYDPILDFGWKESGDPAIQLGDRWKQLCQCLEVVRA